MFYLVLSMFCPRGRDMVSSPMCRDKRSRTKTNICTRISEDIDIQFSSIPKPVRRVHKSETLKETTRYQGPKTYLLVQGRATSAREKRNQGLIRWLGRTLESLCKNASAAQCLYDHCFCCHPLMLQIAATKKAHLSV